MLHPDRHPRRHLVEHSAIQWARDRVVIADGPDPTFVVYDATSTLAIANAPYDALMGDTTTWRGIERNNVWRHLVGPGTRAVHTSEEQADLEARLVTDLRLTAARYPADQRCKQLSANSPR